MNTIVSRFISKFIRIIKCGYYNLFLFLIPNLGAIIAGRLILKASYPSCQQLFRASGCGKVEIGDTCLFGSVLGGFHRKGSVEFQSRYTQAIIKIGNNVATNNNVFILAANNITIADDTLIGQNVCIMDFEAHGINPSTRREVGEIGSVEIGRNVWIGNNVTILKNSFIGDNTIIATGAVVSGTFPANVIIGGVPAKILKNL